MKKINWTDLIAILIISILIILFLLTLFFSIKTEHVKNVNCIDGDTFSLNDTYYRLSYIDTPEKGETNYQEASNFTCNYLKTGSITIKKRGKGIYGRRLAVIKSNMNSLSLNQLLIKECLAEPYYLNTTDTIKNLFNSNCK